MRTANLIMIALMAGALSLLSGPAFAENCSSPLPEGTKVATPRSDVPANLARFVGIWNGVWDGKLCNTLVVEAVDSEGDATVIYSWGTYADWGIKEPGFVFAKAKVRDEKLVLDRFRNSAEAIYWFSGDALRGSFTRSGNRSYISLTRIQE